MTHQIQHPAVPAPDLSTDMQVLYPCGSCTKPQDFSRCERCLDQAVEDHEMALLNAHLDEEEERRIAWWEEWWADHVAQAQQEPLTVAERLEVLGRLGLLRLNLKREVQHLYDLYQEHQLLCNLIWTAQDEQLSPAQLERDCRFRPLLKQNRTASMTQEHRLEVLEKIWSRMTDIKGEIERLRPVCEGHQRALELHFEAN